jgi:hypothetical protein
VRAGKEQWTFSARGGRRARATLPVRSVKKNDDLSAWCQCCHEASPCAYLYKRILSPAAFGRVAGSRGSTYEAGPVGPVRPCLRPLHVRWTRQQPEGDRVGGAGLRSGKPPYTLLGRRADLHRWPRRNTGPACLTGALVRISGGGASSMAWIAPHCRYTPLRLSSSCPDTCVGAAIGLEAGYRVLDGGKESSQVSTRTRSRSRGIIFEWLAAAILQRARRISFERAHVLTSAKTNLHLLRQLRGASP